MDFPPFPNHLPKEELKLPDEWKCEKCGTINEIQKKICSNCYHVKYPNGPIKVKQHEKTAS